MAARDVTASDVAKLAQVSRSAVSMVLNGRANGNVAKESQERIRAAARELGYTPNSVAVSLRNQRTSTLGVVTDEIVTSPFAGRLISGASQAALERGYMVLVIDTERNTQRDQQAIEALQRRRVDGLVYATGSMRRIEVPESLLTQPAVLANCYDVQHRLLGIVPSERAGSRRATEYLLGLGHRNIALLRGSDDVAALLREQGYRDAMDAAGLPAERQRVLPTGWDIDEGYRVAEALLSGPDLPTAVLCSNDRVATGVLLFAAAAGIRVPDQLSVVGYDDQQRVAANMVPALTTVALPHAEIGAAAVTHVIDGIEGKTDDAGTEPLRIPCVLVERKSTGPVPAGSR